MILERLPNLGISLDHVTQQLEDDGVEKFNKPFDKPWQAGHCTREVRFVNVSLHAGKPADP